jgi:hypothetical protein
LFAALTVAFARIAFLALRAAAAATRAAGDHPVMILLLNKLILIRSPAATDSYSLFISTCLFS